MVAKSLEHLLIPYRLRVVRIGLMATWLTIAGLVVFELLSGGEGVEPVPFYVLMAITAIGAGIVSLLPWESFLQRGIGVWLLYAWSALDIVLISLLVVFSGGADSEIFIVYFLTTVFFSASYPEGGQIALLAFTFVCYSIALVVTGWDISWGEFIIRLAVLTVTGLIASFVSRELMGQMTSHDVARGESERRAELLERVARAAREVSALGPDEVLSAVVDAVVDLGFDGVAIVAIDEDRLGFRATHARGLPEGFTDRKYPMSHGLVPLVLARRATVSVGDYSTNPVAMPILKAAGMTSVVSTPLWVGGDIPAVLSAGMRTDGDLALQEIEAVELLAGMASRALENAELYEEEHRTVQRLSEVDRLKDEFLSMVSHDLRTPLTVIEGSASTLDMNWERIDQETRKKLLAVIGSNANKLADIITKLLDLTRMEAGHFEIREEPVEMGQLLLEVTSRLGGLFADHDLIVDVEQPLVVEADPTLIARVAENLLSNAAKYTEPGTKVELIARPRAGSCEVTVRDHGPGIPEEDLEHLGERFFRGKAATSSVRGTGLGLAWVMQILRLHGSELRISSAIGAGSAFGFSLPMAQIVEDTKV